MTTTPKPFRLPDNWILCRLRDATPGEITLASLERLERPDRANFMDRGDDFWEDYGGGTLVLWRPTQPKILNVGLSEHLVRRYLNFNVKLSVREWDDIAHAFKEALAGA